MLINKQLPASNLSFVYRHSARANLPETFRLKLNVARSWACRDWLARAARKRSGRFSARIVSSRAPLKLATHYGKFEFEIHVMPCAMGSVCYLKTANRTD